MCLRILVGRFGFHPTGQCKSEGQQSDTAHEHRNDQGDLPSVRQNGSDARGKSCSGKGRNLFKDQFYQIVRRVRKGQYDGPDGDK